MYKQDLALNNTWKLICHKATNQSNQVLTDCPAYFFYKLLNILYGWLPQEYTSLEKIMELAQLVVVHLRF